MQTQETVEVMERAASSVPASALVSEPAQALDKAIDLLEINKALDETRLALDEALDSDNDDISEEARNAMLRLKELRARAASGGSNARGIQTELKGLQALVAQVKASAGNDFETAERKRDIVESVQEAQEQKAKLRPLVSAPPKRRNDDIQPGDIVVTARRPAKAAGPAAAQDDDERYVGIGKARRERKATSGGGKLATSAINTATFGIISEELADEAIATAGTATYTIAEGAGAMLMGDDKASDKAAQTAARGARNVLRDVGVSAENAEWVGRGVHNTLWGLGRAGSVVGSVTVAPVVNTAQAAYEGGKTMAASAWSYMTGSEAKAATPQKPKPTLTKFELEIAQAAKLDANHDGKFDEKEIAVAKALARKLNGMGVTMQTADKDHNGDISAAELSSAIRNAKAKTAQKQH